MGVGDDPLHARQAAAHQTAQELDPEGGGFRLPQAQPEDLAAAVLIDAGGDYRGARHDAPSLAKLDVGRIEPAVGPLAVQRPLEERQHARVDVLTQSRNLRLGDARHAQRLDEVIDLARGNALDPRLLDHGGQGLFGGPFSAVLRGSRNAGK
jgi:hypothetical protein